MRIDKMAGMVRLVKKHPILSGILGIIIGSGLALCGIPLMTAGSAVVMTGEVLITIACYIAVAGVFLSIVGKSAHWLMETLYFAGGVGMAGVCALVAGVLLKLSACVMMAGGGGIALAASLMLLSHSIRCRGYTSEFRHCMDLFQDDIPYKPLDRPPPTHTLPNTGDEQSRKEVYENENRRLKNNQ